MDDGEPLVIGRDVFLGERVDLTECDCDQCIDFRESFRQRWILGDDG